MANFLNRLFKKQTGTPENEVATVASGEAKVLSPLKGNVIPLKDISDPVFSQELMGKGIAIEPTEGKVVSPINGTVVMVFETNHAIGLKSDDGVEVLIHVGMDTVELKGKGFTAHVKNGDKVSVGDLLTEFDMDLIKEAGYSLVTPIVVTNTADYQSIDPTTTETIEYGDHLLTISK